MAGSRTLKLSILADVDDLKKKLGTADNEVQGFGGKLEKFGKVAAAAFAAAAAAAAAYAGKLAIEGVKAAIEDEAAQKRLETALQNVTNATDAQIAAVEEQILQTSLATGVADDKLRPALQRLAIATGDVTKSQDLLTLALDISAATGKDVETVSNALGKAYEGNTGALTRLGVGLSAAEIKTLGLEGAITTLSDTFGGAAATQAETFEGKIARVQVAFDETKEAIGTALLPIVEKLLTFITQKIIPGFTSFKTTAIDPVIAAINKNKTTFEGLYDFAKDTLLPFFTGTFTTGIKSLSSIAGFIVNAVAAALRALEPIINAAITSLNTIIRLRNAVTPGADIKTIGKVDFSGTSGVQPNTVSSSSLPQGAVVSTPKATTLPSSKLVASTPIVTTPAVSTITVPTGTGAIPSSFNPAAFRAAEERGNVIVNVNAPSAIDEEGFTRAVILALNNTQARTGGGGGQLVL